MVHVNVYDGHSGTAVLWRLQRMQRSRRHRVEDAKPVAIRVGEQPVQAGMVSGRTNDAKGIAVTAA